MIPYVHYYIVYNSIFYRYVGPEEVTKAAGIHEDVNHDDVWINVGVAYNYLNYFVKHVHA